MNSFIHAIYYYVPFSWRLLSNFYFMWFFSSIVGADREHTNPRKLSKTSNNIVGGQQKWQHNILVVTHLIDQIVIKHELPSKNLNCYTDCISGKLKAKRQLDFAVNFSQTEMKSIELNFASCGWSWRFDYFLLFIWLFSLFLLHCAALWPIDFPLICKWSWHTRHINRKNHENEWKIDFRIINSHSTRRRMNDKI